MRLKSVFQRKPFAAILYSEIAWAYMQVTKTYGIAIAREAYVCCKNSQHFIFKIDFEELGRLLENYIIKFNQNIIIGYGPDQKKQYKKVKKTYKNQFQN